MRRTSLVGLLLALAACGGASDAPATQPAVVVETTRSVLPSTIDEDPAAPDRIKADIVKLASPEFGGRGTGEPGGRMAADLVAKRFAELGLEPLGDPEPGGKSFFQAFRARVGAHAEAPRFDWPTEKRSTTREGPDVRVADGSASGTATGLPLIVGYGISAPSLGWDDYAKAKLEGKIAVVLDGAPNVTLGGRADALHDYRSVRYKIRTAREHGAVGVLVLVQGPTVPEASSDASSMGIPAAIVTTGFAGELAALRTGVAPKRKEEITIYGDAKRPKSSFDDPKLWSITAPGKPSPFAPKPLSITTAVEPLEAETRNVVALLPARADAKTKGEYVVVGAHYDHLGRGGTSASRAPGSHEIHAGADDNASGVALMLEVARRLSTSKAQLERGVIFIAFGAEELGVLGSRHFVDHPPVPVASMVAMLNADMVGRLREDKLLVDGTSTAKEWPELVKKDAEGLHLDVALGGEGFGASDHASFTAARVPVAFFFTGVHDDYHRPSDTAEKINAEGEARVATLAARLAREVADAPTRMTFVEAPADPHHGMRGGFKVSLGTLPDYAFAGKGVRLTGTRPDSPAARGGLRAGDVIVEVGPHAIGNIHDYMFALGDLEPGREVTVVVERDGARATLKVVPAPPQ